MSRKHRSCPVASGSILSCTVLVFARARALQCPPSPPSWSQPGKTHLVPRTLLHSSRATRLGSLSPPRPCYSTATTPLGSARLTTCHCFPAYRHRTTPRRQRSLILCSHPAPPAFLLSSGHGSVSTPLDSRTNSRFLQRPCPPVCLSLLDYAPRLSADPGAF